MKRMVYLAISATVGLILLYISRFWPFEWWERPGLFGSRDLPPGGAVLRRWLNGTEFAPYDIILWFIIGFVVLTVLQSIIQNLPNDH
ncbi:MAG: hypothetical protein AAF412_01385 [Pseudomonadota bacterium]